MCFSACFYNQNSMMCHILPNRSTAICRPLAVILRRQQQLLSPTIRRPLEKDLRQQKSNFTQLRMFWSSPITSSASSLSTYTRKFFTQPNSVGAAIQPSITAIHRHQQLSFPSTTQGRCKHSQTQIKRIFKRHPARLRVEKRLWNIDRKQPKVVDPLFATNAVALAEEVIVTKNTSNIKTEDNSASAISRQSSSLSLSQQQEQEQQESVLEKEHLMFPMIHTPAVTLPNGWFEPMDPTLRPKYPFHIKRTKNKPKDAVGFLPIYTKYRKDGTKIITRIKKVTGDLNVFVRELRIVLNLPQPANQLQSYDDIKFRTGNIIEIHGHRANELRKWLGGLGF